MSLVRTVLGIVVMSLLASCTPDNSGLEQEVSALRDEMSTLQDQVDELAVQDEPPASSTTSISSTTSTSVPVSTTTSTIATTTTSVAALPAFPPEREQLTHGGDTWVVVLAASEDSQDPELSNAVMSAEEAGYNTGLTDCDFGAAEALGLPDGGHYYTVSVYLSSEEDANAARDAFAARGVDGVVALVQTFCLD